MTASATMAMVVPAPQRKVGSTIRLLFGDLRTGRILGEIDAATSTWSTTLNGAGTITATVTEDVVRVLRLRWTAPAVKTFLAVEVDDRIQEAGPLWSRSWDDEKGELTLRATGLWGLFDHRKVLPALLLGGPNAELKTAQLTTTLTGADLGEIARGLVDQAMTELGGNLPLLLPAARPGSAHTETFPGYKMLWVGQQLKELTQREVGAPDIRFPARRKPGDRRFLEWLMETGTEARPQLAQVGGDWVFDHTARRSPVVRIGTDEDATVMAQRAFALGNGMEENQLIARSWDTTLLQLGWPLLEIDELRSQVEIEDTLTGHARALRDRSARPIEVWKVVVRTSAVAEVLPGDYCRVRPKSNNAWLGEVRELRMRVAKKSGDLGDDITLDMYPLEAIL